MADKNESTKKMVEKLHEKMKKIGRLTIQEKSEMDLDAFLVDLITLAEEVTKNQPGLNDICFVGYIELISDIADSKHLEFQEFFQNVTNLLVDLCSSIDRPSIIAGMLKKWREILAHVRDVDRTDAFTAIEMAKLQNCGDLFVKIGSASQQMQMLDIIHSYLSNSELFAKWHEILFGRAIKCSEILSQYISSKTVDTSNVSLLHKQMLLLFINQSATEQTVHSEMVQRVAFGESIKVFRDEEGWVHLNLGSKTVEFWMPCQSTTIKFTINKQNIRKIQIKDYGTCLAHEIKFLLKDPLQSESDFEDIPPEYKSRDVCFNFDSGFHTSKVQMFFLEMFNMEAELLKTIDDVYYSDSDIEIVEGNEIFSEPPQSLSSPISLIESQNTYHPQIISDDVIMVSNPGTPNNSSSSGLSHKISTRQSQNNPSDQVVFVSSTQNLEPSTSASNSNRTRQSIKNEALKPSRGNSIMLFDSDDEVKNKPSEFKVPLPKQTRIKSATQTSRERQLSLKGIDRLNVSQAAGSSQSVAQAACPSQWVAPKRNSRASAQKAKERMRKTFEEDEEASILVDSASSGDEVSPIKKPAVTKRTRKLPQPSNYPVIDITTKYGPILPRKLLPIHDLDDVSIVENDRAKTPAPKPLTKSKWDCELTPVSFHSKAYSDAEKQKSRIFENMNKINQQVNDQSFNSSVSFSYRSATLKKPTPLIHDDEPPHLSPVRQSYIESDDEVGMAEPISFRPKNDLNGNHDVTIDCDCRKLVENGLKDIANTTNHVLDNLKSCKCICSSNTTAGEIENN